MLPPKGVCALDTIVRVLNLKSIKERYLRCGVRRYLSVTHPGAGSDETTIQRDGPVIIS